MLCQLRPQFTEPRSALTVLPESPRGIQNLPVTRSILQFNIQSIQTANWQWLSMPFPQSRLWIKRIHLRYATVHEQEQHALGARRVMRKHAPRRCGPGNLVCKCMKCQRTKPARRTLQPPPAVFHSFKSLTGMSHSFTIPCSGPAPAPKPPPTELQSTNRNSAELNITCTSSAMACSLVRPSAITAAIHCSPASISSASASRTSTR